MTNTTIVALALAVVLMSLANMQNIRQRKAAEQREKEWQEIAERVTQKYSDFSLKMQEYFNKQEVR